VRLSTTLLNDSHFGTAGDLRNEAVCGVLLAQARHGAYGRQNERSGLVAGQRGGCDAEETELGGEDGLFFELVVSARQS